MLSEKEVVELIEQNPILYDTSRDDYRNPVKKAQKWEEIARLAKISSASCQKFWRATREKYVRQRKKRVASGAGADEVSQWHLIPSLGFLDAHIKPRTKLKFLRSHDEALDMDSGSFDSPGPSQSPSTETSEPMSASRSRVNSPPPEETQTNKFEDSLEQLCSTINNFIQQRQSVNSAFGPYIVSLLENIQPTRRRIQLEFEFIKMAYQAITENDSEYFSQFK